MTRISISCLSLVAASLVTSGALAAVKSAELYTPAGFQFGRFEARVRYAAGSGVVSSFFLWKDGSEQAGKYWNELDFEKLGGDCHLQTNTFFKTSGNQHPQNHTLTQDICGDFHTYAYEWTPEYIAWSVDGVEIRRETDAATTDAFASNTPAGMQIRFNVWPGDASFGGAFDPSILPVKQQVDWVQYSSYANGAFKLEWRDEFDGATLDTRWATGNWGSPKNHSTHDPANVALADGYAVLSLTNDTTGSGGSSGQGGSSSSAGAPNTQPPSGDGSGCSFGPNRSAGFGSVLVAAALALLSVGGRRLRRPSSLVGSQNSRGRTWSL